MDSTEYEVGDRVQHGTNPKLCGTVVEVHPAMGGWLAILWDDRRTAKVFTSRVVRERAA